ncbi:TetR/AcrR family transcriptional regulator [Pseudonocardia sp. KRD291]|uniref:TetR/AcrR family transcriptional regulator n=1 Tax=Pseudonocardia sp. KRD291 TaxID=2792007 RepID=UPI001C4A20D3|nr:TetR/AcrR family transcriptional regulator [Pseudonocardia sp. KRD291]MBW0102752.1 TetR/AcrR family transcriptional regulator [Pseudonocardia sp. KRD291]
MTDVRPRRTGRPPLTDRATLLAAAREIGFADLTVGTVTAKVGVKYSTFYRHFSSYEALLSAAVDEVLAETTFPEPAQPWRTHISGTSAAMFELLHRNPGLAHAIVALPERPDRLVTLFRQTSEVLLEAGFDGKDTVLGATGTFELAIMPWIDSPGPTPGGVTRREQARVTPEPLDERVREAIVNSVEDPPTGWVADKVDLMIDGLEVRLARSRAARP